MRDGGGGRQCRREREADWAGRQGRKASRRLSERAIAWRREETSIWERESKTRPSPTREREERGRGRGGEIGIILEASPHHHNQEWDENGKRT